MPIISFIIPFRAPETTRRWGMVSEYLSHTVNNLLRQENPDIEIHIMGNSPPACALANDSRVQFHSVDEPVLQDSHRGYMERDRRRKIVHGVIAAARGNPDQVMPVDADDRVHPRLAAFLEETPHHPAWVIRKGRVVHAGLKRSYSSSRYDELTDSSRILSPEGGPCQHSGTGGNPDQQRPQAYPGKNYTSCRATFCWGESWTTNWYKPTGNSGVFRADGSPSGPTVQIPCLLIEMAGTLLESDAMEQNSFEIRDCVVLCGTGLEPFLCKRFVVEEGIVRTIDKSEPVRELGAPLPVILPSLINGHTHMGDSFLPDGATGMTLEEGFFRPDGYKYRKLAEISREEHGEALADALQYMAATGTVAHLDFREQGPEGAKRLRAASEATGVDAIILGQINEIPFSAKELTSNSTELDEVAMDQYRELLELADGISESTINDLTDPAWKWLRAASDEAGKLRAIHCLENAGYRETSLAVAGRGDLERALDVFAPHIVVHLTVANTEEIRLLAESSAVAVLNPRANAALGLPLPPIRDLIEAGVPLMLGTDNGLLNSPNLFAELDFTYKVAKSQYGNAVEPDPVTILQMATSNVRHLKGAGHSGFLEEGQPASFVVVDGSQKHIRRSRHITATLLTRVTPADILATCLKGRCLHGQVPISP